MKISADHYLDGFGLLTNIRYEIHTSVLMLQLMLITNFQDCSMMVVYIIIQSSKTILLIIRSQTGQTYDVTCPYLIINELQKIMRPKYFEFKIGEFSIRFRTLTCR